MDNASRVCRAGLLIGLALTAVGLLVAALLALTGVDGGPAGMAAIWILVGTPAVALIVPAFVRNRADTLRAAAVIAALAVAFVVELFR